MFEPVLITLQNQSLLGPPKLSPFMILSQKFVEMGLGQGLMKTGLDLGWDWIISRWLNQSTHFIAPNLLQMINTIEIDWGFIMDRLWAVCAAVLFADIWQALDES